MTETRQKLCAKYDDIKKHIETLDADLNYEELQAAIDESKKLAAKIDLEDAREQMLAAAATSEKHGKAVGKSDGFAVTVNAIKTGRFVDALGTALQTGGLNGENYLLPEDVQLAIRDMKKEWLSAKSIINVEPTTALSGSFNYGKDPEEGLVDFDDGDEVDSSVLPEFTTKKYTVKWVGALIPVSNILIGAERAELMPYLRKWFVRRSIIKENKDIFAALKSNYNSGTPKALADEKALRESINTDLDPAYVKSMGMRIVTNQSGFNYLDSLYDTSGRPILQPDPTKPTVKTYKGYAIDVFSNRQLPDIDATHAPIIYGNTEEAITMKEYQNFLFDSDNGKGMGFAKNQTLLKVIEGYALVSAITDAYIYGSISLAASAASTPAAGK